MQPAESFTAHATPANFGGRRRSHGKKLRMVKKKTVRRMLKKMGLKMRGGAEGTVPMTGSQATAVKDLANGPDATKVGGGEDEASVAGRRHRRRSHKRTHRRSHKRSLFGMRY